MGGNLSHLALFETRQRESEITAALRDHGGHFPYGYVAHPKGAFPYGPTLTNNH